MRRALLLSLLSFAPAMLFAESATPSIGYTGAPADHNGQTCNACHSGPVNPSGGSLAVTVGDYAPNIQQIIKIVINDPQAVSWGFQITIREISDETQSSGTFSTNSADVQVVCDDGSQFGSAPPCTPLPRQFAEHKNAPRTAAGAGFEFDVPWTPPEQEVGRLHVYVAAVAGNGDGTAAGDHVYTFVGTIANIGGCSFAKEPILLTAVNAGSFKAPFSSNALIGIFGDGFQTSGRTRTAGLGDFVNGAFPTILGCVSVQVTGPGIAQPVLLPITYVSEGQINAQLPEFSGVGPVNLAVILNAGRANQLPPSSVATLNALQPFAPAFFLFLPSSSIAAQFAGTADVVAQPSVVPGARPARPGDLVTLYGTGFGDTNPAVVAGQLATGITPLTNPITVTIGSVTLSPSDVLYAGLSPSSISGLYQFNLRIPLSTPSGDIPVTITIGGAQTQAGATIPVQQ
jgi:uncharacterized protein (TIGR03437 family)